MALKERKATKDDRMAIRTTRQQNTILSMAADDAQKSVSAFVLDSAIAAAEERLADRVRFSLDSDSWNSFLKALEAPPKKRPNLQRLAQSKSILES